MGRAALTRFDFLSDGLPDVVVWLREFRLPRRLRAAAWTLATVLVAYGVSYGVEELRVHAALATEARETERLDAARTKLAAADLELHDVLQLLETDRRLHAVRASGALAAAKLVRIGNLVPRGVWLSSIAPSASGVSIEGEALDVTAVDRMIDAVVTKGAAQGTRLTRLTRIDRSGARPLVGFAVEVPQWP